MLSEQQQHFVAVGPLLISVLSATLSGNRTVPKSVGSVCTAKYNIFKCFCYGIHLLRALT